VSESGRNVVVPGDERSICVNVNLISQTERGRGFPGLAIGIPSRPRTDALIDHESRGDRGPNHGRIIRWD